MLTSEASTSAAAATELSIPATSSSMMRYFIGQYLQGKEANLIKIQKLMFGPDVLTEEQKLIVMNTINDYRDNVFKGSYPPDDNYETQYESVFKEGSIIGKKRKFKSILDSIL